MPSRRGAGSALSLAAVLLAAGIGGCSNGGAREPLVGTAPPLPSATAGATVAITVPPTVAPPAANSRYVFPIQGCAVSYGRAHHDYPATDLFAARGCRVVSPVAGRVDEVSRVDRWKGSTNKGIDRGGKSFSVIGDDGVRYYGSHLSSVVVYPGQRVVAGQTVGRVGRSGSARGTKSHLHFGLSWPTRAGVWWVRRGEVAPWPYLDSWRIGGDLSPATAVRMARAERGEVPPCPSSC